ncbi:hypothetical protein [Paraburkholderia caballeronis]|uniref:hypothetical protein n=1 Tax=Paraburkholderia caballeronis TaxID=416943 RepID=UPI0015A6F7BC|nr:hypothetical protein [Paraburkholderia caballeronis]
MPINRTSAQNAYAASTSSISPRVLRVDALHFDFRDWRSFFRKFVCASGRIINNTHGATCHASVGQNDETRLGGGRELASASGTFRMPNISPDRRAR